MRDQAEHNVGCNERCVLINSVKFLAGRLIKEGKIRRSFIGIGGQNVTLPRRLVRFHHLTHEKGIQVETIEKGSPAHRAGLLKRDILIGFDGQPLSGIDDLHRILTDWGFGKRAVMTVIRYTDRIDLEIVPVERKG